MAVRRRVFLGGNYGFAGRQRVYGTAEALEVDENEGWDVRRRRVFYDDILLVTYHRYLGWAFLLITGLAAGLFGLIGLGVAFAEPASGISVGLVFAFPFALAFLLRLIFRVDVVTVYGRRTKAVIKFSFRKARAREVFDFVCELARRAQGEAGAEDARGGGRPGPGNPGA